MSELISSFLEHTHDLESGQEESSNELSQLQSMDLYNLLLHKPQNQDGLYDDSTNADAVNSNSTFTGQGFMDTLSTNNLVTLNNEQFNTTIPPTTTINPRDLSSHHGSISSVASSDFDNLDDNGSVSSSEDQHHFASSRSTPRPRNWSMNDEFNDAINTWLRENDRTMKRNSISHIDHSARTHVRSELLAPPATTNVKVSNTHTNNGGGYQRSSVTKRRKSESHINVNKNTLMSPMRVSINNSSTTRTSPLSSTNSSAITTTPTSTSATISSALTGLQTNNVFTPDGAVPMPNGKHHTVSKSSSTQASSVGEDEEKPFKCNSCTKAFRRSEHLKRHVRSVHSNVRPFPCKFCEKKFSRSDNLAQHLRTHNKH